MKHILEYIVNAVTNGRTLEEQIMWFRQFKKILEEKEIELTAQLHIKVLQDSFLEEGGTLQEHPDLDPVQIRKALDHIERNKKNARTAYGNYASLPANPFRTTAWFHGNPTTTDEAADPVTE